MPITVQHQPSPLLVGDASYAAGLGELRRYMEQQALRNRAQQLNEAQFGEQQQQNRFRNQLALDQLGQQAYQFDRGLQQRAIDSQLARQTSLAARAMENQARMQQLGFQGAMRQQEAMQQGAMQQQELEARMAMEGMQQEAITGRQNQMLGRQEDMQLRSIMDKRMMSDWAALQPILAQSDPSEREELIGQFQQKWSGIDTPMPMDVPEPPQDPFGPDEALGRFAEQYPSLPWYRDPATGEPALPRGWNYQMDPEYQRREQDEQEAQRQQEIKVEELKAAEKEAAERSDAQRRYAETMAREQKVAEDLYTTETPSLTPGGQATIKRDEEKIEQHMLRAHVLANSSTPPPAHYPPVPPQYKGMPWTVNKEQAESMPFYVPFLYLQNGEWVLGERRPGSSSGPPPQEKPRAVSSPPHQSFRLPPDVSAAIAGYSGP